MKACLIEPNGKQTKTENRDNLDAFFYIDDYGKEIVIALHYRNGKPLFIIDRRKCDVPILIEENSQATYLINSKGVKGIKAAQEELSTL